MKLRLKECRTASGKTQLEIAQLLGITRAAYSNIEAGRREPDFESLNTLADHFGVSVDYLMGREQKEKPAIKKDDEPHKIPGYDQLTPANKAAIDQLIANLLKSQSDG